MDLVVEAFDLLMGDRIYATLYPGKPSSSVNQYTSTTFSSIREGATAPAGGYQYKPSSQYFSQYIPEPSHWAYESAWARDNIYRQFLSLYFITWYVSFPPVLPIDTNFTSHHRFFGLIIYFLCAGLSYLFVFDHATMKHPKYLKNQVRLEIMQTMYSMPFMSTLTAPLFLLEVRGWTKLYDSPDEAPFALYNYLQFPLFLLFTDFFIYWIHRTLHHPLIYKHLHKPHHKWVMPTPFASHAFHPVDGFSQSVPYHIFPFVLPLQKIASVALFIFINIWTIFIHDGEYVANNLIINGAACHALHHTKFDFNYGQFTTLFDRMGGTYYKPPLEMFMPKKGQKKE